MKFERRAFVVDMKEGFSEIHSSGCETHQQCCAFARLNGGTAHALVTL